jgi:hypothetical protein
MQLDDAAMPYDAVVRRARAEFPAAPRGHIESILVEEHEIIAGGVPGDLVPGLVVAGVRERLAREASARVRPDTTDGGPPARTG